MYSLRVCWRSRCCHVMRSQPNSRRISPMTPTTSQLTRCCYGLLLPCRNDTVADVVVDIISRQSSTHAVLTRPRQCDLQDIFATQSLDVGVSALWTAAIRRNWPLVRQRQQRGSAEDVGDQRADRETHWLQSAEQFNAAQCDTNCITN